MDNWSTKEEGTDLLNQSCVHCYHWAALQGAVLQCVTVCYSVLQCVAVCYCVTGEGAVALMMTNNAEITSGGIKPHNR